MIVFQIDRLAILQVVFSWAHNMVNHFTLWSSISGLVVVMYSVLAL